MIISQHGFAGAARFDAARVAAGVVTGVGFLGGGLIIKKSHISGLTTAAAIDSLGKKVKNYTLSKQGNLYRASVSLFVSKKESNSEIFKRLGEFPGVELEGIE